MAKDKILVVDDEKDILDLVEYNLKQNGYKVSCVATGEEALEAARSFNPDLILLDLMLPGVDGFDVCKDLKSQPETSEIPVIMLTAKSEDIDVVTGLELGADDYITKPFSPRVLVARVRAILRNKNKSSEMEKSSRKLIRVQDILIDTRKHVVLVNNQQIDLTFSEFRLLETLAERPGWVFSRYQIVDALRGDDYPVTERSVDVQVVGLRKKLGTSGKYIQTVRGVGYRFKE
ncbi:two-component system, OmpR family, phosphate regulon response regulator PhoB [Candidatus Methanophagaceae archaeon]|nr:two-component system, OmpR family, phosphate regulon response regulator PhoB [Methanophagales archaeon]